LWVGSHSEFFRKILKKNKKLVVNVLYLSMKKERTFDEEKALIQAALGSPILGITGSCGLYKIVQGDFVVMTGHRGVIQFLDALEDACKNYVSDNQQDNPNP
jgi:hypothetical protein